MHCCGSCRGRWACREKCGRFAAANSWSAPARSTTRRSSHCSKDATARRASCAGGARDPALDRALGARRRARRARNARFRRSRSVPRAARRPGGKPRRAEADARCRDEARNGTAARSIATLQALKKEAGAHTAALRLELRALQGAGRHAEIPPLIDQLVKRKVYGPEEGEYLRAAARAGELRTLAHDPSGLRAYWNRLVRHRSAPAEDRARGGAKLPAAGGDREAAEILARSLERNWDPSSSLLYAECRTSRSDAATRAGRAVAHRAQPGCGATPRAGRAVRAGAALGQGADLFRGEPRARGLVSDARRAGRALRATRP